MSDHTHAPEQAHSAEHPHIHPKRFYVAVFAALLVLTAITTWVAFIDLGPMNTVVALVIAVCKACLVVLFFMHLKEQQGMTRTILLVAVLWLAVFIVIAMGDHFTRKWIPSGPAWEAAAPAVAPAAE